MYGLIDISHRYNFHNKTHLSSIISSSDNLENAKAKKIQSAFTKLLYNYFTHEGYTSIEEYVQKVVNSYTEVSQEAAWDLDLREIQFLRVYDTFYYWRTKEDTADIAEAVSRFVTNRNDTFGEIFLHLGSSIRDVDEDNTDLNVFVNVVSNIFAVDDVVLWKFNPTNKYLVNIASTMVEKTNATINKGIVAQAINNRRAVYFPNIRNESNYLDKVQHPDTVLEHKWKGVLVCPLHFSKNLVGVIGLYSKHNLLFSKIETSLLLYLFANLSKRIGREVFGATGSPDTTDTLTPERLLSIAPALYVGMKSTYRLHSIKNKIRDIGTLLEELKPNVIKTDGTTINWQEKVDKMRIDTSEVFRELEDCIQVGSDNVKRHKLTKVHYLAKKIQSMVINHNSEVEINRTISLDYNKDSRLIADVISVEQAVYNVIENAFFFLSRDFLYRRQPEINVHVSQEEKWLELTVRDNANGMTSEERENCRKLYFSGERKNGSGLGLWMTERIVNEHFGTFEVNSNHGDGTDCLIRLPLEKIGKESTRVQKSISKNGY